MTSRTWLALAAVALAACGSPMPNPGGCPSGDAGRHGDPVHGALVVQMNTCNQQGLCHGSDLSGSTTPVSADSHVYPANLTPDATGLSCWTDAQIETAVRTGVAPTRHLCPDMLTFPQMSATDMVDLIAYIRSVPPVARTVPASSCP
jgi:hypothetical protein